MLLLAAVALLFSLASAACPEDYQHEPDTNRCIRVIEEKKTFFQAQQQCAKEGGYLAALPRSKILLGKLTQKGRIFTGLNRLLSSDWKHLDRSPVRSSLTLSLKANNFELCSYYDLKTETYGAISCDAALPFACSRSAFPKRRDSCPTCPDCSCYAHCQNGWTYFDQTASCYRTFFNADFNHAEGNCTANGAHLTSIHSDQENEFVVDLASSGLVHSSTEQAWFGLYQNIGKWVFTDGTPLNYTRWKKDSFSSSYKCAFIYADETSGSGYLYSQWDGQQCEYSMRAYVCKKAATFI